MPVTRNASKPTRKAKSALAETPMTRALGVQEILQRIFQHNGVAANQACACVNRSWYNVALDHLWHTVTVLSTLLQILAPMTLTKGRLGHGQDECIFARVPLAEDWQRFYDHTRRVKSLKIGSLTEMPIIGLPRSTYRSSSCSRIFADIALMKPFKDVFPSLRYLECTMEECPMWIHYIQLFLGERLSHLKMNITRISTDTSATRCIDLIIFAQKAPNVEALELVYNEHTTTKHDDDVTTLVTHLKKIKRLTLSACILNMPEALAAAALHPTLEHLTIVARSAYDGRSTKQFLMPEWSPDTIAFRNLIGMKLRNSHPVMIGFLQSPVVPTNLVEMEIEVTKHMNADKPDPAPLFECIADKCRSLRKLVFRDEDNKQSVVAPSALDPFTRLAQLTHLSIKLKSDYIDFTEESLVAFLAGLPNLQYLDLPHGGNSGFRTLELTPRVLQSIARTSPQLTHLGLLIEASRFTEPACNGPAGHVLDNPPESFPNLSHLTFGASPIFEVDVGPLACYLSKLLPPTCVLNIRELEEEKRPGYCEYPYDSDTTIRDRLRDWVRVKNLLKLFIQARMEERNRRGMA